MKLNQNFQIQILKKNIKIMSKVWGVLPKLLESQKLKVKWIYDFTRGKHT